MQRYTSAVPIRVVPLLNDAIFDGSKIHRIAEVKEDRPLRLLYVGTHIPQRRLKEVYEGCDLAAKRGVALKVISIGAADTERRQLLLNSSAGRMSDRGELQILLQQPRDSLLPWFKWADVGLCLIPPIAAYVESSPTKLAEYLGAGLPVLASAGIPAQEAWVLDSGAGHLVEFGASSIGEGIEWFWRNRKDFPLLRESALNFSSRNLKYSSYVNVLQELLTPVPPKRG